MPRPLVLAACLALALPFSALAVEPPKPTEKWVALEAEDFRFISAISPRETRTIARDLLRLRAALGIFTDLNVHSAEPTRVFVFPTQRRFAVHCEAMLRSNCDKVTGLFIDGNGGNFILMPGDAKGGVDRVVYHELTHHLMANTNSRYPLWFKEGLAEYFSTFRTAGDEAHLGVPVHEHMRWLREESLGPLRKRLIPLRELFTITSSSSIYNEGTRTGVFYAESWALVHYLMHNDDRAAKLQRFLILLSSGKPVDDAFKEAFAMPYSELEQALRTYILGKSFTYYARALRELTIPEVAEPAAMPYDAVLQQLGHLLMHRPQNAAVAERFFTASLAANDGNAGAHAGLARLHDAAGRTAEADAAFAKAAELGSDDVQVYLLAGRRILNRDISEVAKARPFFKRATELDPKSAAAWTGLGATYLGGSGDLASGIAALKKSLELDPSGEEAAFYLAQLWANAGQFEAARALAQGLSARTTDQSLKKQLAGVMESIERQASAQAWTNARQSAERAVAMISEATTKANSGRYKEALALIDAALPLLPNEASRKKALALRDQIATLGGIW